MEIFISDSKTLGEIKKEFNERFPHLKLEFYGLSHKEGEGSPEKYHFDDSITVSKARSKHVDGHLSIIGSQNTKTLEQQFKDFYGLNVQVFRKSGKLWMQTTSTDHWTLEEQESHASIKEHERDLEKEFPDMN